MFLNSVHGLFSLDIVVFASTFVLLTNRPITMNATYHILWFRIVIFVFIYNHIGFGYLLESTNSVAISDLNEMIKDDETVGLLKNKLESMQQEKKHDIVFLIDSSGSVGKTNFRFQLKFVRKILNGFNVGRDFTRVAIVRFSSLSKMVRTKFKLCGLVG